MNQPLSAEVQIGADAGAVPQGCSGALPCIGNAPNAAPTPPEEVQSIRSIITPEQTAPSTKHPVKRGRPSKFTPAMLKQARFLAARGATDSELADFFEVSESTLNLWKLKHGEFSESLKEGKAIADSRVQAALFQRAVGYSYPDTHVSNHQGTVTLTPIMKHYPPDTTAAIFWLKNRRPEEWRDKIDGKADQTNEIRIVIGGEDD